MSYVAAADSDNSQRVEISIWSREGRSNAAVQGHKARAGMGILRTLMWYGMMVATIAFLYQTFGTVSPAKHDMQGN